MVVKVIASRCKCWTKEGNWQSGFTLWELLLVLFLMGILLASVTPHFGSAAQQVRVRIDAANKLKIEGAVQLYRIDVGSNPTHVLDLVNSPEGISGWQGPYLKEIPLNPLDNAQSYQIDSYGQVK